MAKKRIITKAARTEIIAAIYLDSGLYTEFVAVNKRLGALIRDSLQSLMPPHIYQAWEDSRMCHVAIDEQGRNRRLSSYIFQNASSYRLGSSLSISAYAHEMVVADRITKGGVPPSFHEANQVCFEELPFANHNIYEYSISNSKPYQAGHKKLQSEMEDLKKQIDEFRASLLGMFGHVKTFEDLEERFPALMKYVPAAYLAAKISYPVVAISDTGITDLLKKSGINMSKTEEVAA